MIEACLGKLGQAFCMATGIADDMVLDFLRKSPPRARRALILSGLGHLGTQCRSQDDHAGRGANRSAIAHPDKEGEESHHQALLADQNPR